MRKLTWQEVRIIWAVAIVIFGIGVVCGLMIADLTPRVEAAAVDAHDEIVSVDRSLIEGGAMPCENPVVSAEKAPVSAPSTNVEETVDHVVRYSVDGHFLGQDLERYLYEQLEARHIGWMYQTSLCQIYQESRFNCMAINRNGLDMGLCQFRITYFGSFAQESGLVTYDIWNPVDQIYVYAWLMAEYIKQEGSVEGALSRYYLGTPGSYSDTYVRDVLRWQNTIQEVKQ